MLNQKKMEPWLGITDFLTDSAEQVLLERRGREIMAQQARREAKKAAEARAKSAIAGNMDDRHRRKAT